MTTASQETSLAPWAHPPDPGNDTAPATGIDGAARDWQGQNTQIIGDEFKVCKAAEDSEAVSDPVVSVTRFKGRTATAGAREQTRLSSLGQELEHCAVCESKQQQPLFKFGLYPNDSRAAGSTPSELSAVVGDYDDGHVTVEQAAARMTSAGVAALIYTTASHTKEAPRWRVVVPLNEPVTPADYASLVGHVNGILGGILARESWEATRCYFYGRVRGVQYLVERVDGYPLDLVLVLGDPEWEPIGPPSKPVVGRDEVATPLRSNGNRDEADFDREISRDTCTETTVEELASACRSIPADKRETWVEVGLALASLKGTEYEDSARDLWLEWSQSSSAWNEGDEAQWDTFKTDRASYKKVFFLASQYGWVNPRQVSIESERERSARIGREGEHRTPTQRVMTGTEMLEELVFIEEGSRVAFASEPRFVLPFEEFKRAHAGSIEVAKNAAGRTTKVHRAHLWLESQDRKTVRCQTFAPGRASVCVSPENMLAQNLWVPRVATPPAEWLALSAPFFEHVAYLVPEPIERERFLDWMAHIEQDPGTLPSTHYLLVAKQTGIGRNWLAYALARVFAGHVALGFDLGEALRSGFNGALSQTLLAVVDELHEGGPGGSNRPAAEKLKSMLTEVTRRVNPKYGRQHVEFNCTRFLMFSNHEAALPLADNDRRIVVIENPSERRGADYYKRLYALLDVPGFGAAIAEGLRQRDISGFNPGEVAPMTAAKARTIRAGRSEIEQAVRDVAADWPSDCITSSRLTLEVADALGGRSFSTQGACVSAGLVKVPGRVKVGGVPSHVWVLRNTARWSAAPPRDIAIEVRRGASLADAEEFA